MNKQNEQPTYVVYNIYSDYSLDPLEKGIKAERLPEKGDAVAIPYQQAGQTDYYTITGFLHKPDDDGILRPQPIGHLCDSKVIE